MMPMTYGIVHPVLLLPSSARSWPVWQRRHVLLHELAHVRRYDCLTQRFAQIACAVYWFNPLVWIAATRLRVERELACDDQVLLAGARASDYATHLLEVARTLRPPRATRLASVAMARPSQLSGRLLAVLDERRVRSRVSRRTATTLAVATLALVLPLSAFRAVSPASHAATTTQSATRTEQHIAQQRVTSSTTTP